MRLASSQPTATGEAAVWTLDHQINAGRIRVIEDCSVLGADVDVVGGVVILL